MNSLVQQCLTHQRVGVRSAQRVHDDTAASVSAWALRPCESNTVSNLLRKLEGWFQVGGDRYESVM